MSTTSIKHDVAAQPGPVEQHLICSVCGQQWRMVVDADRHASLARESVEVARRSGNPVSIW